MKRMQLFEFEDFSWFPSKLRDCLTLYIVALHRILRTPELIAPLLAKVLVGDANQLVDLCSGGGGPIPDVVGILRNKFGKNVTATLTDLFPNDRVMDYVGQSKNPFVTYHRDAVNAAKVPAVLDGVRTMIASFHHMPPTVAKGILRDAFEQRRTIFIFEISDNSQPKWLWWAPLPIVSLVVLFFTPFIRPLSLFQIVFTYAIPVLPFIIAWDGAASNARTYTADDLQELTADLKADDYAWEIGTVKNERSPGRMLYLIGKGVSA